MENKKHISKAEQLVKILTNNGSSSTTGSTVQRSHRFNTYDFVLIQNLAKRADCSVSAMINQVIGVGIDALYDHMPDELVQEMHSVTQEQIDQANSITTQTIGKKPKK